MNQPDINRIGKYIYIDLKDMLWKLLEQWKIIVAFVLLVVLIMTCNSYLEFKKSNGVVDTFAPKSAEDALSGLDSSSRDLVLSVYRMKQNQDEISAYINESALMEIDANNVSLLTFNWDVKAPHLSDGKIASAYYSGMTSDDMTNTIRDAWGEHYIDKQINELIIVDNMTYDAVDPEAEIVPEIETGHIALNVILPEGVDGEKTKNNILQAMDGIRNNMAKDLGDYSITLANVNEQPSSNPFSIADKQNNAYQRLYNITVQMNGVTATSFSDEQKTAYNRLLQYYKSAGESSDSSDEDTPEEVPQFRMSKKKLLLGAFAAGLLYIFLFFAYIIVSNKVQSAVSLKEISGIRSFGEWYSSSEGKGLIKKITGSGAIYKRQHRNHLNEDDEIVKMADSITSVARHSDINSLVVSASESADQTEKDFIGKLVDKLNSMGLKTSVNEVNYKKDLSIDESALFDLDGVILAVDHNKTHVNDIKDVCEKCAYYNVPVLGSIYLG